MDYAYSTENHNDDEYQPPLIGIESPNVVVYGHDSVYDKNSDKCIHAQRYEEECRNCRKIPNGNLKGQVVRYIFDLEAEGRQCGSYDAKLV